MSKLEKYRVALRLIAETGCMNEHYEGDMAIWCKDGKHSIYCPAGIAQSVLQPSVEDGCAKGGVCKWILNVIDGFEYCARCFRSKPHTA